MNTNTSSKRPVIALLLNLLLAGGGYLYIGQIEKGLVAIIATLILTLFCGVGIFIPILTCIDGFRLAQRLENGQNIEEWEFFWNQSASKPTQPPIPSAASATTSSDGTYMSPESEFATSPQNKSADVGASFLKLRSRATRVGALSGLAGALAGLFVIGYALEIIVDTPANATNPNAGASGIAFISIFLACSGYPLVGGALGALVGRLSSKRDDGLEGAPTGVRYGLFGGGMVGLAIGILPFLLLWTFLLR